MDVFDKESPNWYWEKLESEGYELKRWPIADDPTNKQREILYKGKRIAFDLSCVDELKLAVEHYKKHFQEEEVVSITGQKITKKTITLKFKNKKDLVITNTSSMTCDQTREWVEKNPYSLRGGSDPDGDRIIDVVIEEED